jgi:hypothetical protein
MQDNAAVPTTPEAMATGSVMGAIAGIGAGQGVRAVKAPFNSAINALAARQGLSPAPSRMLKPGARMAGGLMGAILGGGLGAGTRQMMLNNSPAATLLAKAQAQGGLSPTDTRLLAQVLQETYSEMGLR